MPLDTRWPPNRESENKSNQMPPFTPEDVGSVRASFPALSGEYIFFNTAAGSQVLGSVADRYA